MSRPIRARSSELDGWRSEVRAFEGKHPENGKFTSEADFCFSQFIHDKKEPKDFIFLLDLLDFMLTNSVYSQSLYVNGS